MDFYTADLYLILLSDDNNNLSKYNTVINSTLIVVRTLWYTGLTPLPTDLLGKLKHFCYVFYFVGNTCIITVMLCASPVVLTSDRCTTSGIKLHPPE